MFKNIKYGIKNLIKWLFIIWNDRDWDYYYLYMLLHFKLKNMQKFQRKYGHSLNSEEIAESMTIYIDALGRLIEDDYASEEWNALREKWGDISWEDCADKPGYSRMVISGVKTEEDEEKYRIDLRKCVEQEEEAVQSDLSMLFGKMKDAIRSWWD